MGHTIETSKFLTFEMLCEALLEGKEIQNLGTNGWQTSLLTASQSLARIYHCFDSKSYRLKPKLVKRYQWILKNRMTGKFDLTGGCYTEEEAKRNIHCDDSSWEVHKPIPESEEVSDG